MIMSTGSRELATHARDYRSDVGRLTTRLTSVGPGRRARCKSVPHHVAAPLCFVAMPTDRPRISVTKDASLADALDCGRALLGPSPEATLVRDLAVHGARLLMVEQERRQQTLAELAAFSARRRGS
jgi:hypothetical protein